MKLIVLIIFVIVLCGSVGCGSESEDGGPLCSSVLAPTVSIPSDGATGIALDAHPSLFFEASDPGCPLEPSRSLFSTTQLLLIVNGSEMDGLVESRIEGQSGVMSFVPRSPLLPNALYTLRLGAQLFRFSTGTDAQSAPPPAANIKSMVARNVSTSDQSLKITALAPVDAQEWIHLILTDKKGKPIPPSARANLGFIVPASQPQAGAWGDLGFDDDSQVCFVARAENPSGMLSATSAPVCAHAH